MSLPENTFISSATFRIGEHERLISLCILPQMNTAEESAVTLPLLHHEELERAERFLSPISRSAFVRGRAAAKLALGQIPTTLPPTMINIRNNLLGVPVVEGIPRSYVISIAHSDLHAAALCFPSDVSMGIDIETPVEKNRQIISPILTQQENFLLQAENGSLRFLHMLWTAKEAAGKALQMGFRLPLERYEIDSVKTIQDHDKYLFVCTFRRMKNMMSLCVPWNSAVLSVAFPRQEQISEAVKNILFQLR